MLLKHLLPPAVDLSGERSYADNTRADLSVVYSGYEVPVEIKRSQHPQVWSAARDQLIRQYTSVPATDGYGIYLVLWFGKELTQAPLNGSIPADPDEVRTRLEGTLSDAERRKISVVVVDVSRTQVAVGAPFRQHARRRSTRRPGRWSRSTCTCAGVHRPCAVVAHQTARLARQSRTTPGR